mgnify:CR=1 FL=1
MSPQPAAENAWYGQPEDKTSQTDNNRIKNLTVLPPPEHLIRFFPIKFDKLRMKLEAAMRAGYDKAITFEFSHFMSPQSAYLQAGHLFDRYKEYFNIR